MQPKISGHHCEITAALREYVTSKFSRLERHFDHVTDSHVVLSVEKQRQKAEATLFLAGARLFAESEHEDMYAAIDLMIDKLDSQVRKHKEKRSDHHRATGGIKAQREAD